MTDESNSGAKTFTPELYDLARKLFLGHCGYVPCFNCEHRIMIGKESAPGGKKCIARGKITTQAEVNTLVYVFKEQRVPED